MPASQVTLCAYVQFLSRSFSSVTSVKNYLNGVRLLHLFKGLTFPPVSFLLSLTLRGIGKQLFRQPTQAMPIGPHELIAIWRSMDFNDATASTMFCLFMFLFFLMSRKSSLIPPSRAQYSHLRYPCRGDVSIASFGLWVQLKYSKTNQFGLRNFTIPLVAIPHSPLCPVRAFRIMCRMVPGTAHTPLFSLPTLQGPLTVTHVYFNNYLKSALRAAGLPLVFFNGHSFRRGGATWAFKHGVPGEVIQLLGGWTSDAYLRYLSFSQEVKIAAATTFAKGVSRG